MEVAPSQMEVAPSQMEVAPFQMEVAPFFVDFHHFLSIFTIYALLSRFTFCRDLRTFSANFFWPKQPTPQHHTFFACMQCLFKRLFLVKTNIYINGVALLTLYTLENFLNENCKVQISNIENSVNPFEGKAILLKRGFKYQTSTQQQPTQQIYWNVLTWVLVGKG